MRKLLLTLSCVLTLSFLTSCSVEEVDQNVDLLGVWKKMDTDENSENSLTLVFGKDNTGLRIYVSEDNSNKLITSNATPFNWELNNKTVTLLDNIASENNYIINDEGQLVLSASGNLRLEKISNDYSKYY